MKNKRGKGLQRSTLERLDDTSQLERTLRGEDEGHDNDDNEAVTNVTIIKQLGPKKARDAARPRPKMSH